MGLGVWLASYFEGYWAGQDTPLVLVSSLLGISLLGAFGGIGLAALIRRPPRKDTQVPRRRTSVQILRVPIPTLGLAMSILGITLSLVCGPAGCGSLPFRSEGFILVGLGIPLFLGGMVLLASTSGTPPPLEKEPERPPSRP